MRPLALVLVLGLAGCGGVTLPESEPDSSGVIEERDVSAAVGLPNILVGELSTDGDSSATIYFVGDADIAVRAGSGELSRGDLEDLVVGRTVRVWRDGIRLTSDPAQAGAEAVEVVLDPAVHQEPGE